MGEVRPLKHLILASTRRLGGTKKGARTPRRGHLAAITVPEKALYLMHPLTELVWNNPGDFSAPRSAEDSGDRSQPHASGAKPCMREGGDMGRKGRCLYWQQGGVNRGQSLTYVGDSE